MNAPSKRKSLPGLAIILVVVGIALLASNAQMFTLHGLPHFIRTYWPCVILGIGISKLLPEKHRRRTEGMVYLGIGAFFQLIMLDWIPGGFASFWPVASIMFGLWVYFGGTSSDDRADRSLILDNDFELDELFSSRNVTIGSHEVQHGTTTLTFAGLTLHIGDSNAPPEGLTIEVDAWLSALTLRLPPDWGVDAQASTLVSKIKDKRGPAPSVAHRLVVLRGNLHFSSVEILPPKRKAGTFGKRSR